MLDNLRRLGRTWIGKVLGAFLLVGLAGFGISNVLLDFGTGNVAVVGSEDISIREFQRAYNNDVSAFAQQLGRLPTPEEATALGIPTRTLNQLATQAAINRLGVDMGLGVSEERLSRMLREDPTFAGTLGAFEADNFRRVLQQLGYTETEYFDLQADAARRQQIAAAVFADAGVPAAAEELLTRYTEDTRTIDYFIVGEQSIPPVDAPTEEEMAAYLTEHQAEFRTEEQRTADVLVLSLDTLAAVQPVSEDAIAAEYERTRSGRVREERRTIVQAPLSAEQLTVFQAGLAAGRSFDELVTETGVEVVELGSLTRAEVTDGALANAAFGLADQGFAIIPGIGGQRVVAVTAIEAGGEPELAEVRDEIERSLRVAAARDTYIDILDQVEELRAAFQPLKEIGERFSLPVETVTVTSDGEGLSTVESIEPDNRARVATAIFDAEEDRLSPTIAISANNNVFVELTATEAARDQTLDEVREAVAAAITEERTNAALAEAVAGAVERLEAGETIADVAFAMNTFPSLSSPIGRNGDESGIIDGAVAAEAFRGGAGHIGSAVNEAGEHVVLQVAEVISEPVEANEEMNAYLQDAAQQSLFAAFATGLRDQAGVRINRQALDQAMGLNQTGQ